MSDLMKSFGPACYASLHKADWILLKFTQAQKKIKKLESIKSQHQFK